jgi:hypothetical protein
MLVMTGLAALLAVLPALPVAGQTECPSPAAVLAEVAQLVGQPSEPGPAPRGHSRRRSGRRRR